MKQIAYGRVRRKMEGGSDERRGTLIIQHTEPNRKETFKILGVFSDFSVVKIRFLMRIQRCPLSCNGARI